MKKILLSLILLFTLTYSFGDKKKVIVIDNNTQEELIGVKLTVDSTTYYTDFDGLVEINLPDDRESIIKVEYPSYETKEIKTIKTNIIKLDSK